MTSRERIQAILNLEVPEDRIGITDSYWPETVERWHNEGLPEGVSPLEFFDTDFDHIYMDASLRLEEAILEETDEYTIRKNKHGFTAKVWKGRSGALGYLDHTIKTRENWERLQYRLEVDIGDTSRIGTESYFTPFLRYPSWSEMAARWQDLRRRNKFVTLVVYAPFEATWRKHGFERTLMNMVEDPGLVEDMFDVHTTLVIETVKRGLAEGVRPDGLFLIGDIGYRNGVLFSPSAYEKLLFPYHQRLCDYCNDNGIAPILHTDGDIRSVFSLLIEAGFRAIQPLEASAGLDVRELKQQYGNRVVLMGNISAPKMSDSQEIEAEIKSKLLAAKEGGGYIYHSDHSVPSTVSFDNYRVVMELVHKYGRYDL